MEGTCRVGNPPRPRWLPLNRWLVRPWLLGSELSEGQGHPSEPRDTARRRDVSPLTSRDLDGHTAPR